MMEKRTMMGKHVLAVQDAVEIRFEGAALDKRFFFARRPGFMQRRLCKRWREHSGMDRQSTHDASDREVVVSDLRRQTI